MLIELRTKPVSDLQVIAGNARRNRKLRVIQQVGSSPTILKAGLVIWQDISSEPVFPRKGWFSFCPLGYIPAKKSDDGAAKVIYTSKDRKSRKVSRLIQQIYEVDPLICPKCQGSMKIISIIDDFDIIEQILRVTFRLYS